MINQLINFAESIRDEQLKKLHKPRLGLHIRMSIKTDNNGRQYLAEDEAEVNYWNGKTDIDDFLFWTADKINLSWSINTNKCLDLPAKGIHSCSPYCIAFKRDSLEGGEKHDKDKVKIYDRFTSYFSKAYELVEEKEKHELKLWESFFTNKNRINDFIERHLTLFEDLKNGAYLFFYLNESREKYEAANKKYLADKLFNTTDYNIPHPDDENLLLGTSDFMNGFNSNKPFLEHKTASFKITGRISSNDALGLYRFQQLMRYPIFPSPLPIFVSEAERKALQQEFFDIAQLDFDGKSRPSHSSVMKKMLSRHQKKGIGNYYLLYHSKGDILDFDFVPKFKYSLKVKEDRPWVVKSCFGKEETDLVLGNVFDFQDKVLPVIFNNTLVVIRKEKPPIYRWFEDLPTKLDNTTAYLVRTYRMAFYNFIYKSRRTAVTHTLFQRLMKAAVLGDIPRQGDYAVANIYRKLNVWFSLYNHFNHSPNNNKDMVNHLESLREFTEQLVTENTTVQLENAEQFAFVAGQLIAQIFKRIKVDKQPHSRLDKFIKARSGNQLRKEISKLFTSYSHEMYSKRFGRAMAQLMASKLDKLEEDFLPFLLAGYFSDNLLSAKKVNAPQESIHS